MSDALEFSTEEYNDDSPLNVIAFEDEYDPLEVDDEQIDQEWMDDDNPLDVIDYPTLRNMPEDMPAKEIFTVERHGSAEAALRSLMNRNPIYRPLYLRILDLCREGTPTSTLTEKVEEWTKDNRSTYAPTTLCRTLERAGGLTLQEVDNVEEHEVVEEGVVYLEITEHADPVWTTTEEGLKIYGELTQGDEFRAMVIEHDARYKEVYLAYMATMEDHPMSADEVEEFVKQFPITQSPNPRRFGMHFIDVLLRADAVEWSRAGWELTALGKKMFAEYKAQDEALPDTEDPVQDSTQEGE